MGPLSLACAPSYCSPHRGVTCPTADPIGSPKLGRDLSCPSSTSYLPQGSAVTYSPEWDLPLPAPYGDCPFRKGFAFPFGSCIYRCSCPSRRGPIASLHQAAGNGCRCCSSLAEG